MAKCFRRIHIKILTPMCPQVASGCPALCLTYRRHSKHALLNREKRGGGEYGQEFLIPWEAE